MKQKVYIETSVISYITARLSGDLIIAGHQKITHEWWDIRRNEFELYVSQLVINEAARGDSIAAKNRMSVLREIPLLQLSDNGADFAKKIVSEKIIPEKAAEDAIHIAVATIHRLDYLLTWNCRHIANAQIRKKISNLGIRFGFEIPVICTPEELMGER